VRNGEGGIGFIFKGSLCHGLFIGGVDVVGGRFLMRGVPLNKRLREILRGN